jgi:uncharacterized protein YkwD
MNFGGNWIDLLIVIILLVFVSEVGRVGFWVILADFVSFLGSLLISLRGYQYAAGFLRANFSLPHSLSNALGFLFTAVVIEMILGYLLIAAIKRLPDKYFKVWWNKFLAVLPATGEGLVLVSFILTLIVSLPVNPKLKSDVSKSKIGSYLVRQTVGIEKGLNEIFGGVIEDSLTYLTIRPGSRESIPLNIDSRTLSVDEISETEMFKIVNAERRKAGVTELSWAPQIVPVSRAHARDMWERSYFSHVSPEGRDVGDRLGEAGINYNFAGENLALAPTLAMAHNGLMNSEGHRANILEPSFKKIGIGVIDNGIYGKMFVQVFTD